MAKIKLKDAEDRAKNKTQANAAAKQKLKPEILIPKILQLTTGHTPRHDQPRQGHPWVRCLMVMSDTPDDLKVNY